MSKTVDSSFFTPASGSPTFGWIKKDLDQKADKDWVEAKLETLRDKEEDTKEIAIKARERASMPHDCKQSSTIEKLESSIDGWGKWLRGLLVGAISFLVFVGSGWLYQYFSLTKRVEDTQVALTSIESKLTKVDTSQKELKTSIEDKTKKDADSEKLRLEEVKSVIIQAVKDINKHSDSQETKRGRK